MVLVCLLCIIDICLKRSEISFIYNLKQTVEMPQCCLELIRRDQAVPLGVCQFIKIHNPHLTVRVDDHIR